MSSLIFEQCHEKCRFVKCVDNINNVITKASLYQVKQYVSESCENALFRFDSFGRLPIHVAASCGNVDVLEWLVSTYQSTKGADRLSIDITDKESGWSALHRAVYYGRMSCIILLLKNGADMWLKDKDGCNIFDFMVKDVSPWFIEPVFQRNSNSVVKNWTDLQRGGPNEVYTWGTNENMTLGDSGAKTKSIPEIVRLFSKRKLSIKQVVLCKYHAVFLTHCGHVYTCGSGRDGQLGSGKGNISLEPHMVDLECKVHCIAASTHHSVFVLANGRVWTCGRNHHHALGVIPPPLNSSQPVCVTLLQGHHIIGCAAGSYHTAVWSKNSLFTFGTNAGQLGHSKVDLFIDTPRKVSAFHGENKQFVDIHASDAATVVASTQGIIFLLHRYVCRKILSRHTDIIKVQVGGGLLDDDVISKVQSMDRVNMFSKKRSSNEENELKVLMLKNSGDLLSWRSTQESADHCHFNTKQLRWVRDIAMSTNGSTVILTSVDGTAYFARYFTWFPGKKKSALHKQEYFSSLELIECDSIQMLKLEQIPCVFRAHTAALGPKGNNAAILQSNPCNFLTEVPVIGPPNLNSDLSDFYRNTFDSDLVHDVIIRIRRGGAPDTDIAAHLFLLASRSRFLFRIITSRFDRKAKSHPESQNPPILVVENVYSEIFKDCIEFLYSGQLPNPEVEAPLVEQNYADLGLPVFYWDDLNQSRMVAKSPTRTKQKGKSRSFELNRMSLLHRLLSKLDVQNIKYPIMKESVADLSDSETEKPESIPHQHIGFSSTSLPYLYDCIISCSNGAKYSAHKCLLAARIPYFAGMLFSPWINKDDETPLLKVPVPSDIFRCVLEFAYFDSPSCFDRVRSIENRCEILAAADLLLMDRLKQIAEAQIAPMLTLKNVSSVVDVSVAFNAIQLYNSCLQFMCHHLNALLFTPTFYNLDDDTLEKLENAYRSYFPQVYMQAMPPCSDGPIIDHIPEEGDDSVGAKRFNSKQRLNVKISAKRNKSDQLHTSRRKLSEATSLGVLLSDLLRTSDRSQDEIPVQNIKKRQHRKSETMDQHDADVTEVIEEPKMEKVKRRSKNKPKPMPETQSPFLEPKTESKNVVKSPPKETVARPVGSKITAISKAQSYANYEMFFPELGATPAQKVTTPSKGPSTVPACAPKLRKSSESFSNPYDVEIIKVKKKPSKKDRRKSKNKPITEKSKPIDIKPEKTNVWGVPLKSPEEYAMSAASPLSPDRMTSPFASATYLEPKSPPSRDGVWQNPPLSYGSPPFGGLHRSESATSADPKPTIFIDILQDEIRNREIAEKISKKSMASIQLEETAMNELKLYYESSNRSKATFFTVSRVDHVTSKEIEDFRKSANQK